MSDHDETRPIQPGQPADQPADRPADPRPEPPADTPAAAAHADQPVPSARTRLRERAFGFKALAAATVAALLLGGLGGAAIGVLVDGDGPGDHGRMGFERGRPDFGGPFGRFDERGFPPAPPGELPESTTPDDEDTSPAPSESPTDSSNS
ncbi:hypothetical protein [Nocardioides gansuensis]|nr:hypothetical protein [Nocardioides gansuensis]